MSKELVSESVYEHIFIRISISAEVQTGSCKAFSKITYSTSLKTCHSQNAYKKPQSWILKFVSANELPNISEQVYIWIILYCIYENNLFL